MIQVVVLLRAGDRGVAGLRDYERRVLPVLDEHGGRLLTAFEPIKESPQAPDEIHVLEFASRDQLQAYRSDARVAELAALREEVIRESTVFVSKRRVDYAQ